MASWAAKIKAHGASKQRAPRKPRPEVQTTWAQTRFADSEAGDPGAVIDVHFIVEENTVTLTDEKGKPIGSKASSYVLQPGEIAVQIAKRMALANWRGSDAPFNRQLNYQPSGIA
jgi:hypothetical protein